MKKKYVYICFIFTILLWLPAFLIYEISIRLVNTSIIYFILAHISYIDLREKKIPNIDILLLTVLFIIEMIIYRNGILEKIAVFFIVSFLLILAKIVFKNMMGFGDVKLISVSSLWLGIYVITAYLIGVMIAGVVFGGLLMSKKLDLKCRPAVGPFFSLGIWLTYLYM